METAAGKIKKLYRSRSNKLIFGVCGGVGQFLGLDPVLIRIAWVLTIFIGGAGIFAYLVAAVLVPRESEETIADAAVFEGSDSRLELLAGSVFLFLGALLLFREMNWIWSPFVGHDFPWYIFRNNLLWAVLLIGVGCLLVYAARKQGAVMPGAQAGKRFTRSATDRRIWGVCGGLGQYFEIDATVIRIMVVLLALLTQLMPVVVIYFLMMVIVPSEDKVVKQIEPPPPQSPAPPAA